MALSRLRTISLLIAAATLSTNALSSLLFHQLPDDPYHISTNFSSYLYFANLVSVLGLIGAFSQHALSVSIFSNYLILDTILCAIPRILVLSMLSNIGAGFCEPESADSSVIEKQGTTERIPSAEGLEISMGGGIWLEKSQCSSVITLASCALFAGIIAATLLQFVGALQVREYGKRLAAMERREIIVVREGDDVDVDVEEKEYEYLPEYADCVNGRTGAEATIGR